MTFYAKRIFVRLYEKAFDEDIFSGAAVVAFYFMFSLFPLLLFLVSLFGLVLSSANDLRRELFLYLRKIMPPSAYDVVEKTLTEVVQESSTGTLTLGFIIALWAASAGIESAGIALNGVYKLKEKRSWWWRKLEAMLLTLVIALLIFFALGLIFYGSQLLSLIFALIGLPVPSPLFLQILSLIVVGVDLILTLGLIYTFCPNHSPFTWKWITPGAFVAIGLWLLLSAGFRLYLSYFDYYAKTYGSLGAIIILMFWLYLTALVLLIGGAINAILDEFTRGKYDKHDTAKDAQIQSDA